MSKCGIFVNSNAFCRKRKFFDHWSSANQYITFYFWIFLLLLWKIFRHVEGKDKGIILVLSLQISNTHIKFYTTVVWAGEECVVVSVLNMGMSFRKCSSPSSLIHLHRNLSMKSVFCVMSKIEDIPACLIIGWCYCMTVSLLRRWTIFCFCYILCAKHS